MLSGGVGQLWGALWGMPNSCFLRAEKRDPGRVAVTLGDSDGVFLKPLLKPSASQVPPKDVTSQWKWNISIVWEHPRLC